MSWLLTHIFFHLFSSFTSHFLSCLPRTFFWLQSQFCPSTLNSRGQNTARQMPISKCTPWDLLLQRWQKAQRCNAARTWVSAGSGWRIRAVTGPRLPPKKTPNQTPAWFYLQALAYFWDRAEVQMTENSSVPGRLPHPTRPWVHIQKPAQTNALSQGASLPLCLFIGIQGAVCECSQAWTLYISMPTLSQNKEIIQCLLLFPSGKAALPITSTGTHSKAGATKGCCDTDWKSNSYHKSQKTNFYMA